MTEVVYKTEGPEGREIVSGLQIGRFAVRRRPNETYGLRFQDGRRLSCREWLVDHINTGYVVLSVDTFEDAVLVADDVSRFAKRDVSAKTPQIFLKQVGIEVHRWLAHVSQIRNKVIDFRTWKKIQSFGAVVADETHHQHRKN